MNQITFNNKSNYTDFEAILNYFKPQPPSPKIIKVDVPYMNGFYDFSTVGSNGELVYSDRKILCSLQFLNKNKTELYKKYSEILNWLMDSGKQQLVYSAEPDTFYLAKIESVPSWDYMSNTGTLQFEFTAEPFKYGLNSEGSEQLWDTFNFEQDYLQESAYYLYGYKEVTIYNCGRTVIPEVITSSNMSCTLNGYTANFTTTKTKDYGFKLKQGFNTIAISGTGSIEFNFRKTML